MSRVNREKYEKTFAKFDEDNSGKISESELVKVLADLGKQTGEAEVSAMFKKVDVDGSGQIDKHEFLMFMESIDNAWIRVQQKTFTRWSNTVLSNRMLKVDNIAVDFRDGTRLQPLIEVLAKKTLPKINKKPKMRLQKMENLNKSLEFLKSDGVKLVNVGADDLEEGNLKIILGLIWTLILKYQIGEGLAEGSPKWVLLEWVKKQTAPYGYGQNLKNFKSGWSDGKVLSALCDSLGEKQNATIDCTNLDPDPLISTATATDTAESVFEIPRIMDAVDLVENPEEHSIMTYVSYFRDWADTMKARASPGQCTAHGPGVDGGDIGSGDTSFTIVAANSQGAKKSEGGDQFAVTVTDPSGASSQPELKDNGDGTYSGNYPLTAGPGDYKVDIALRNDPIKGSQFTARMESGNAGNSYAEGPGLSSGKTRRPCEFTIVAVDKNGDKCKIGGDPFKVEIAGPNGPVIADMKDNGDGTYPVKYVADAEGSYNIGVTLFDEPIKDAPFTATIKRAPNAALSYVQGPGLSRAYDNKPASFTVHALDDLGAPVAGDECVVTIKPEDGQGDLTDVPVEIKANDDGTYECTYAADKAGNYEIVVTLDGGVVKGTPKKIRVREGADVSKLGKCKFKATIMARNKSGEPKTEGGDDWAVDIKTADGEEIPCKADDHGDGSYSVEYKLEKAADSEGATEFVITMKLNGDDIPGSPFKQFM